MARVKAIDLPSGREVGWPWQAARQVLCRPEGDTVNRVIAVAALAALSCPSLAAGLPVAKPETQGVSPLMGGRLDSAIREAIDQGKAVGAVCVVGHNGHIVYRKAFGYAQTVPVRRPMKEDTLFDLASLTKCVATATSVMTLVEQGRL
jgi:CubicO group peptidase (beta-lactamase class C family)